MGGKGVERRHMCKWHGVERCIRDCSKEIGKVGTHYCRIPSPHQFQAFRAKTLSTDSMFSAPKV